MTQIFNERSEIKTYGENVASAQYPIPTDENTIYAKDVKLSLSDIGTFTGTIESLFNNLDTEITDTSETNPKYFEFFLERPFRSGSIALVSRTGNFSNIKVIYKDRQNSVLHTIDDTANNTKYTSHKFDVIEATNVCCIRIEFHTVDPVKISFIYLRKVNTVRAYLAGTRDDGTRGNVILDDENRLQVNSQPYLYGIAEGAISGHTSLLKFGARTSVAANTQSLVWQGTNALYTYLTSAEQLKIVSTSTDDTSNGVGVRTFTIYGLDANWNEISETVALNGTTPVQTTLSFIRLLLGTAATCGTSYTNVGVISITNNAGTNQLAQIFPGDASTMIVSWTVPSGKTAYITQGSASTDSNKGARISMFTRINDGGILYPWVVRYRAYIFSGNSIFPFNIPFAIPEKTDIEVRVLTPASAGTTSIGATFELWYENND